MSRNYEQNPASFAYLLPFMSREDREIHEELCGREPSEQSLSRARKALHEQLYKEPKGKNA